jgi:Flp pilus assembly protein TadG
MATIRRLRALLRDCRAATAVEFALLSPVLCFLLLGGATFALAFYHYGELTEGVRAGARQLAISLNDSTPFTDTVTAITGVAPGLNAPSTQPCSNSATQLCVTVKINGSSCSTDSACVALMSGGVSASVSATYPCNMVVMGHNFVPSCQLSSKATEMIE